MATIVNNPPSSSTDNGMGTLLGIILLIVVVALFIIYGLPYIANTMQSNSPQINIPGKIDVNVQQSPK